VGFVGGGRCAGEVDGPCGIWTAAGCDEDALLFWSFLTSCSIFLSRKDSEVI
jgi:hypothetical protein